MKRRLVKDMRESLGWTPETADKRMKLTPGTWAMIESGKQPLSVKQFIRLFSATFRAAFGTVALQQEELEEYQAELAKANGIINQILTLPQNEETARLAKEAQAAIDRVYTALSKH